MCDDARVSMPSAAVPAAPDRLPLLRPRRGRRIAGVCAALSAHLGVDVRVIRLVMIVTSLMGGLGAVLYLFLWMTVPPGDPWATAREHSPTSRAVPPLTTMEAPSPPWWAAIPIKDVAIGAVLVTTAALLIADRAGVHLPWGVVLAVVVTVIGLFLAWGQLNETQRGQLAKHVGGRTPTSIMRITGGIALVVVGVVLLLGQERGGTMLMPALVSAVAVLVGAGLVLAPWWLRLMRDLADERASSARARERADIAAHLHDSVLQTLALIQRSAHQPGEVTRLARNQERELRQWLYEDTPQEGTSVQEDARALIATIENDMTAALGGHEPVTIDVVIVGDTPPDDTSHAMLQALGEGVKNAVRHGRPPVSVYLEISDHTMDGSVTDRGDGFDIDAIPHDRFGVRESIIGRVERRGGTAQYKRRAASGTELRITVPRTPTRPSPQSAQSPEAS